MKRAEISRVRSWRSTGRGGTTWDIVFLLIPLRRPTARCTWSSAFCRRFRSVTGFALCPWGLRALLGYDQKLCAEVVRAFVSELSRSLRRRAKTALRLSSVAQAHTGAVAAIQRTDGALRLNVHLHVLALDGVHVREQKGEHNPLVFHALGRPTRTQVTEIAARTAARSEVVPRPPSDLAQARPPPAAGDQLELLGESIDVPERANRKRWAWLLAHVFRADVDTCPHCGGAMRWLDVATTQQAATHLLARLGLLPQPPPVLPPLCPAQLEFAFPKRTR